MPTLKHVNTIRLTGQRYIELTKEQWVSFNETNSFIALVYPSYSLRIDDCIILTCKIDPIYFNSNPKEEVKVKALDNSHILVKNGGYLKVEFSLLNEVR